MVPAFVLLIVINNLKVGKLHLLISTYYCLLNIKILTKISLYGRLPIVLREENQIAVHNRFC